MGVWDQVAAEVVLVVVAVVGARGVADLRERGVLAGVGRSGVLRATEEERVETILGGMRLRTGTFFGFLGGCRGTWGFSWWIFLARRRLRLLERREGDGETKVR